MACNIKVGIRCRPFTIDDDLGVHLSQNAEEEGEVNILNSAYSHTHFAFTWSWWSAHGWQGRCKGNPPEAEAMNLMNQEDIYNSCGRNIKADLYDGKAVVLMGYGLSGSGKTFTLFGPDAVDIPEAWFKHHAPHPLWGIFPRLVYELFNEYQDGWKVTMRYFQNVVDVVRDLMSPIATEKQYKVGLRKDADGFMDIDWLCEVEISSWDDFREKFMMANARKAIAPTQFNRQSTRGHCIVRFDIEIPNHDTPGSSKHGRLFVFDLAGTEPAGDIYYAYYKKKVFDDGSVEHQLLGPHQDQRKTKEIQDQGKKINLSLSELAQFYMKMANAIKRKKLKPGATIPGCNSYFLCKYLKNTMVQATTNLICAIRPEVTYHKYTYSTLGFAANANSIKPQLMTSEDEKVSDDIEQVQQLNQVNADIAKKKKKVAEISKNFEALQPFFLLWDHETSPEEWWDETKSWERLATSSKGDGVIETLSGVTTDEHGNITEIDRHGCGLRGVIPESLGTLPFLETVSLSDNALSGPIPMLKNVRLADFAHNKFSGDDFMESIQQLVSLVELDISNNQISGDASGVCALTNLKVLNLSSNMFAGNVPISLSCLSTLECLDFSTNKMRGNLSVFSLLTKLKSLDLSDNEFEGFLPQFISEMPSLEVLKMQNNKLTGGVSALYNLKEIHLAGNELEGHLLENISEFTRVEILDLSNNRITGSLDPLSELTNLKKAILSRNMFSGNLPQDFLTQSKIMLLDVSFNPDINGAIPQSILNNREMHIAIEATGLYSIDVSLNVPQFDLYMVPRQTLFEIERMVIHEEALNANLILALDVRKKFEVWVRRDNGLEVKRDSMVFMSHRWLAKKHPDDKDNSKLQHIRRLAKEHADWQYFWIDFFCVPQDPTNHVLQQNAINSLPNYVKSCGTLVTLCGNEGEASLDVYKSRGWCRLEQISSKVPLTNAEGSLLTTWLLICNKDTDTSHPMEELASSELNPLRGNFFDPHDKIKLSAVVRTMCKVMIDNEKPDLEGWKVRLLGENILKSHELSEETMNSFQEEAQTWQKAMEEEAAHNEESCASIQPLNLVDAGQDGNIAEVLTQRNALVAEQLTLVLKAVQEQKEEMARLRADLKDVKDKLQYTGENQDSKGGPSFSECLRTRVAEARNTLLCSRESESCSRAFCAECETQAANVFCITCEDPFCHTCWATFHKKGKRKDHSIQSL